MQIDLVEEQAYGKKSRNPLIRYKYNYNDSQWCLISEMGIGVHQCVMYDKTPTIVTTCNSLSSLSLGYYCALITSVNG